jgi:drug/metabolite transporter (DMT)-like permease
MVERVAGAARSHRPTADRHTHVDAEAMAVVSLDRYRNLALFVLLAVLFGISFVAIKAGLRALPPIFFAALRFDVAAPILLVLSASSYSVWRPRSRADVKGVVAGAATIVTANNALLFLGQQTITPAAASVMYSLAPVLSPVVAFLLLDQRIDVRGAIGILLGLFGVVVIVQPSPETLTSGSTLGQLYVFGSALAVALGSVLLQRIDATMGSVPLTAWAMALGAILLHGWSAVAGESVAGTEPTVGLLLAVLVVGVPSTAGAYAIYFTLIGRIGPIRTNLVAYVTPVVAATVGWILLDEPVTLSTAVGFCVIVLGVSLLERRVVAEELGRLADALGG